MTFYEIFLSRYTAEEFAADTVWLQSMNTLKDNQPTNADDNRNTPQPTTLHPTIQGYLETAQGFFQTDRPTNAQKEALLSVRLGGVSTRTIRNWKTSGRIYSERSSRSFNYLFDSYLPERARVDRRKLAWLWVAHRMKLSESETDDFLVYCMDGQSSYVLDTVELAVRACLTFNVTATESTWDFFDAVLFGLALEQQIADKLILTTELAPPYDAGNLPPDEAYSNLSLPEFSQSIMSILNNSKTADCRDLSDQLGVVFEEGLKHADYLRKRLADEYPSIITQPAITTYLNSCYSQRFGTSKQAVQRLQSSDVDMLKDNLRQWVLENSSYFQAAYFSRLLALLKHLISLMTDMATQPGQTNFFKQWFYLCSLAVSGSPHMNNNRLSSSTNGGVKRANSFPVNTAQMADILWHAEGADFGGYAKEHCLLYLERIFDVERHLSRRTLIEYYLLVRLHHTKKSELETLLHNLRFKGLDATDDELLVNFLNSVEVSSGTYNEAIDFAVDLADCTALPHAKEHGWPIREKLFYWDYKGYR